MRCYFMKFARYLKKKTSRYSISGTKEQLPLTIFKNYNFKVNCMNQYDKNIRCRTNYL